MTVLPYHAKFVTVAAATTAAAKQAVAALTGSRIRVHGIVTSAVAAQNITLQSSTGGVYMGPLYLAAAGVYTMPNDAIGYCVSTLSRGIYIQHDAAAATRTQLIYSTYAATA